MTVCGNTTGDQHHRCTSNAYQLVAQAQRTLTCVAHAQLHLDLATHSGDAAVGTVDESDGGKLDCGSGGETHGGIR